MAESKKIIKMKDEETVLKIVEGKVVPTIVPAETVEMEVSGEGQPTIAYKTPGGEAVYRYFGDCTECKLEKVETPVFVCITHPVRADNQIGNNLAGVWNDGGNGEPLCQKHYARRVAPHQKVPKTYEVLEKRW